MLVCRWWDFESANLFPGCRRGDKLEGCCVSTPLLWKPDCEVWVEGCGRGFVVKGFTVAFQRSMSIGEKEAATLSLGRSGEARGKLAGMCNVGRLSVRCDGSSKTWVERELTHGHVPGSS
jgi:hypothetical protein